MELARFPQIVGLAAHAAEVARTVQVHLDRIRVATKDDRSPVTVADWAVQAAVSLGLRELDPGVPIVGEERADDLRRAGAEALRDAVVEAVRTVRPGVAADAVLDAIDAAGQDVVGAAYWTLDPIDGTKGFLRGGQYALALARIEAGRVTAGILACPNLDPDEAADPAAPSGRGTVLFAQRGGGAFGHDPAEAPRRIRVAAAGAGPIRICESVEAAHSDQALSARIAEAMGASSAPIRIDSQAKYALVAQGRADLYLRLPTRADYRERIWDHAAGTIVAEEAGAFVCDVDGKALDFGRGRCLDANRGVVCGRRDVVERTLALGLLSAGAARA